MATINNNEKRLLTIFGVVVFIAANVFGFLFINGLMKGLTTQKKASNERLRELKEAQQKDDFATQVMDWMAQNFKSYPSEEYRETYLAGVVFGELTTGLDVDLSKDSVLPTETGTYVVRSRFRVNVKGPWTDVYKFIYRLQKPEEFRFVPRISMTPKKNETDDSQQLVEVQVEIEKWWPKPDGFADGAATTLAENEQPAEKAVNTPGSSDTAAAAATDKPKTPEKTDDSPGVTTPAPAPANDTNPSPAPTPAPPAGGGNPPPEAR